MKRNALRTLCLIFVLSLCIPLVACDMQFGGLIGELITNNQIESEQLSDIDIESVLENIATMLPVEPDVETDAFTGDVTYDTVWDSTTRDETIVDGIDEVTTEPPVVIDPVMVYNSFDELRLKKGEQINNNTFFTPGVSASWNNIAKVYDYAAEYLSVFGWAGFFAATPGTFGYQIDGQEPVFSETFSIATEQAVIDVSLAFGGKSGSRYDIQIPIRELSGTHTIKAIAKDEAGTIEVITEFTLNKAVDPYAPVSLINANEIYSALSTGTHNIFDAAVQKDGFGNPYVRWTTTQGYEDPYVNIQFYQENNYVSREAQYLVIKCRIDAENLNRLSGTVFVGSAMGPVGGVDQVGFDYAQHSDWQLVIIDLAAVDAVDDQFSISYLRLDCYDQAPDESAYFDIAYIATFNAIEDIAQYDYEHPMAKES